MNPSCRWARQGRAGFAAVGLLGSKQTAIFKENPLFSFAAECFLAYPEVAGLEYALKKSFRCHIAGWREAVELGAGTRYQIYSPKKHVKCQEKELCESGISRELFPT